MKSSMCSIAELPDELLVNIVDQLDIERGFLAEEEPERRRYHENAVIVRSLHALALSCRRFNAITSPVLYRCIIIGTGKLFFSLLFRTLFSKPSLCGHVQYIEFAKIHEDDLYHFSKADHDEFKIRKARIQPRLSGRDRWSYPEMLAGRDIVAVILTMMDHLRDASLPDEPNILKVLGETHRAGRLGRLWLNHQNPRFNFTLGFETRLPYVHRFMMSETKNGQDHIARYLRCVDLVPNPRDLLAPLPVMKEISLVVQDIDRDSLREYLVNCTLLKRFSCRWVWADDVPDYEVELPALHQSLLHVYETLTHLTIHTSKSAAIVYMDSSVPALGSLRDFKSLKYLDVTGLVLWGNDDTVDRDTLSSLLPVSLETLIIHDEWDDDIEIALFKLSSECTTSLPNLRTIRCNWSPAPRPNARLLSAAFQSLAVKIILDIEDK